MGKPVCKLVGESGNIFNLASIASKTLRDVGQADKAREMSEKLMNSSNYNEALQILMEYVVVE